MTSSLAPTAIMEAGRPYPLGATWDGLGVNFALFSADASAVSVSLFDGNAESRSLELANRSGDIWHGYLPGIGPGQGYGFRVSGPYLPDAGLRFNHAKLLIDPYARVLSGVVDWTAPVFAYRQSDHHDDHHLDPRDSAGGIPIAIVYDERFDWEDDRQLNTPWEETVIYEAHVKGLTARRIDLPEPLRGTYAGLGHPTTIDYLLNLGVTAVELLPVQAFVDDKFLVERGLRNYWGYSTLGFFAPESRYAVGGDGNQAVVEFKSMVKALHRAKLEVILDVVYNHTCEGNHLGPTLSWRGIDNRAYYRQLADHPRFNEDLTGTGNTLNIAHPSVLRFVMDSLRYWVDVMHVDGFRFDLAPVLGRDPYGFDAGASFFDAMHQDPVLSRVKLIAEPWDLGHGGYQLGLFPTGWSEWNDRFRDSVRGMWLGHRAGLADLPARMTGSPDIFRRRGRGPCASVNYVTAHDGFTLHDLVSYDVKHNLANGEDNRDGADHNLSNNHGVEGPTNDPALRALRLKQMCNLLATLLLARGVPMICAGDERGRTQRGNNNAYCQDNAVSWINWEDDDEAEGLTEFVRHLIQIRRSNPLLRQAQFDVDSSDVYSPFQKSRWFFANGREMTADDQKHGDATSFALELAHRPFVSPPGQERQGAERLLILFNPSSAAVSFTLPADMGSTGGWSLLVDTAHPEDDVISRDQPLRQVSAEPMSLVLCGQ